VYACLLFLAALLFFTQIVSIAKNSPFAVLGHGREMFQALVLLQFTGIYLFMPAITCGVLTQEKERDSLALLFLTRLGPWTILFEKLLARLIPMFTFMLLCLPLLAFAYSLGGITPADLARSIWLLTITIVQVGTLALACSAYYRTTVAAFVATYLWGVVFSLGLPLFMAAAAPALAERGSLADMLFGDRIRQPRTGMGIPLTNLEWASNSVLLDFPYSFCGPALFSGMEAADGIGAAAIRSLPILFSSSLCLWIARLSLIRRAFAPPRNPVLNFFRGLDALFSKLNRNRLTRGRVLIHESTALPADEPVAWRETTKKSLGTVRYLVRIFVAIEFSIITVCVFLALGGDLQVERASVLLAVVWGLAVLFISVRSASLISSERTHQTLEVLLATPLSGREILLQKFRGVRRLMCVLGIPLVTIVLFEFWWKNWDAENLREKRVLYLWASLSSVGVSLPLVAWLSVWIGLRVRTQSRAMIGALGAIVAWCFLTPACLIFVFNLIHVNPGTSGAQLLVASPMMVPLFNEVHELDDLGPSPWRTSILNLIIDGLCVYWFRQRCLKNADWNLGRGSRD
jgi:ABC-type transport system involved in multi-copper enzyme maturation permease subunit